MALIGSHILGQQGLRILDYKTNECQGCWVHDDLPTEITKWTPDLMRKRVKSIFSQAPQLECFVIVDPGIYTNSCINAAIEVAQKYTTKIKIISALMARFCYVTSKTENPPTSLKEFLIIVTICQELCDWHILQVTSNGFDYITDYLYEKKDFDKTYATMSQRYKNYKIVLLYSVTDEEFVESLTINCEKLLVPNWNQMLTEGGIQKGLSICIPSPSNERSMNVHDFASGMYLSIDGKSLALITQGIKLPVKRKYSRIQDLNTIVISRDYQHVDYDKITRESCVIFEKELKAQIYKFDLNVKIDKSGQCLIDFSYQKQYYSSTVEGSSTAMPPPTMSSTVRPNKESKAVVGYSLFSTSCRYYNPKTKKEEIFKCITSAGLTFTNTSDPSDDSPTRRLQDLLSQLPTFLVDAIVFVHDGRFSLEWLKQARDVGRKRSSRIYFISEPMALQLNALRLMRTTVREDQTLGLTFICGSSCMLYFLKRGSSTYSVIDEAEYSTAKLEKVKNVLLTRRSTDVIVVISDQITPEIRRAFVYPERPSMKVEFIQIENYGKAFVDGAIAKAQKVADGSGDYFDILPHCGQLKLKIDGKFGDNLCFAYDQIPKTIKKVINVCDVKDLKVIQYKSAFSKREFTLYSNTEIPPSWEMMEITIKFFLAGLFEVSVAPTTAPTKSDPHPNGINIPASSFNSSLIPSKTFEGRERLVEQLINLKCTLVIDLREEECDASVEVLIDGQFYQVLNPSGFIRTPAYISFSQKELKIGLAGYKDFRKRPEFVVFDMIRIIGKSTDQIETQPTWKFSIGKNPNYPKLAVYEVETWEGRKAISPEAALGIFLKALKKLAESVTGQVHKRVTIFIPPYFKSIHNTSLKEACNFADLSLSQTMQYLKDL